MFPRHLPLDIRMSVNRRVVGLVGPDTNETLLAMAGGFRRLGWETTSLGYRFIRTRIRQWIWRVAPKLRWHSSLGLRPWLEARWYNRFLRSEVLPGLATRPPDLLLFVRPYRLEPDTRSMLASLGDRIATWATDSLSRYGPYAGLWDIAVRNYVFDGGDARKGMASWLPLGFDDEVYRPCEEREWDVLFVGRIFARNYDGRLGFLQRLADSRLLQTHRVALVGSVVRQHRSLERRFQERGGVSLGDVTIPGLARAIARSRIAVSVHQNDGQQPINPMFFSVPGCRTCLVTDRRDYLARWLCPERDFIPVAREGFVTRLQELLGNDTLCSGVAWQGYQAARRHSWLERARTVLEDVQSGESDTIRADA